MKWKDSNLHSPSTKSRRNAIKPHFKKKLERNIYQSLEKTTPNSPYNHY